MKSHRLQSAISYARHIMRFLLATVLLVLGSAKIATSHTSEIVLPE